MRFILQLASVSIAFGTAVSKGGRRAHGIREDDFVHVKGLRLYDSKGLHYITGTNASLMQKLKSGG
jgi:mannan endo-1,4-beta-mannosidase|tara:strand:+ start:15744 stop:15941 length:198 start_codon:yes stop_codon:yes gene_type:complete